MTGGEEGWNAEMLDKLVQGRHGKEVDGCQEHPGKALGAEHVLDRFSRKAGRRSKRSAWVRRHCQEALLKQLQMFVQAGLAVLCVVMQTRGWQSSSVGNPIVRATQGGERHEDHLLNREAATNDV